MDKTSTAPLSLPAYRQLQTSYDWETRSLWCYLDPKPRPTFNHHLLGEISDLQRRLSEYLQDPSSNNDDVHYFVAASAERSVFNLGGDLVLFVQLINARDREGLRTYGRACVDAVYQNATSLGVSGLTTISLVRGAALGGGFEAALSSNVVIAERSAQMGFPEILFNLFPGMGAYNLLIRRVNPALADRLLGSGKQYSAEEMYAIGIVDALAEDGAGVAAVRRFMRQHGRSRNGHGAIRQVRERIHPLSLGELRDIVEIWVDAAMGVTARDLRTMSRLAEMQRRVPEGERMPVIRLPEEAPARFPPPVYASKQAAGPIPSDVKAAAG